ncbi:MAG: aldehyde ferredoxin oxidoreductase family protein [Tissierellales bacterium]|nr:aldehyde ferredoxin oxidoreductase family protein [Tissierellales bacterium]
MTNAYAGNILHVDLSKKKIWKERLNEDLINNYIGARGINARLLWDNVNSDTDPLGPDNVMIFGAGVLSGTHAPCSGRLSAAFKSPATKAYFKASSGGYFANEMKFAGYDHIIIYGKSDNPVYLWIDNHNVEIRDASHLWGLTVTETDERLKSELKVERVERVESVIIGPAGENKVKFASLMTSSGSALGRGGGGAVMGSKNLKAIAIYGKGSLSVYNPVKFNEIALDARKKLQGDFFAQFLGAYGTGGFFEGMNAAGSLPSYNFIKASVEGAENISGQALVSKGYLKGRSGCASCSIHCHRFCTIDEGKYAGTYTLGPELETLSSFGNGPGIGNLEVIIKAGQLCNDYGLDTISTGSAIQWAIESVERNVMTKEQVDGLELKWGAEEAVLELIQKIALREGIGNLLAEGTKFASEKIGKDSYKWAIQSKGLEQSRCETRSSMAYALAFSISSRGPDHLHSQCMAEFGMYPEALALIKRITGDEKYANPALTEKRAEIVRWHEDNFALADCLGFCAFTNTAANALLEQEMTDMYNTATGIKVTPEELLLACRRIITLERCFNIREGLNRKDDKLPYRLMNEPINGSDICTNSPEILNEMLDRYFELHEWEVTKGCPTRATMEKLGLNDVADELDIQ